ncbi:MAG: response regulator transcription factor [Clostridia bacterium]|nr:response regulator transcription factor [Clostridia bacterium]
MSLRILVAEDNADIANLLRLYLEKEGWEVVTAEDGVVAMEAFHKFKPDLALLDIMMPRKDGRQVCEEIRKESSIPVIMVTAKGEITDKVACFEIGADDYIVKPFDMKEVILRIRAVIRRTGVEGGAKHVEYDGISVDLDSYSLVLGGKEVDAPPKEIELLYFLASNPGTVFTRDQLLDQVWGFDYFGDTRTIDVHVKRLREKLEGVSDKWSLRTVWGVGYKFEVKEK